MSGTSYGRQDLLRLAEGEREVLTELVMRDIQTCSQELPRATTDKEEKRRRLRMLRSLLERLADR